jgi:hypothetical protein
VACGSSTGVRRERTVHVVACDERGFHLAHTTDERERGENTPECAVHQWLAELDRPPARPGVYVVLPHEVDAYSEPYPVRQFDLYPWKDWVE